MPLFQRGSSITGYSRITNRVPLGSDTVKNAARGTEEHSLNSRPKKAPSPITSITNPNPELPLFHGPPILVVQCNTLPSAGVPRQPH